MRFHIHIWFLVSLEKSLDLVIGEGESNGDWPVCKSHGFPIHQVCSESASRLLVPAWLAGELKLATPALTQLTSHPGFLAPQSQAGRRLLANLALRVCAMAWDAVRIAHRAGPCSPGMWTYIVLRPTACMRAELTLARCLLPPISPIKNILPSHSARSSPGPQLYFINTFRQVQKGMIHTGPKHSETPGLLSIFAGKASWAGPGLALGGYHLSRSKARDYLSAAGRTYPQGHFSAPPAQSQPPRAPGREGCGGPGPPHAETSSDPPPLAPRPGSPPSLLSCSCAALAPSGPPDSPSYSDLNSCLPRSPLLESGPGESCRLPSTGPSSVMGEWRGTGRCQNDHNGNDWGPWVGSVDCGPAMDLRNLHLFFNSHRNAMEYVLFAINPFS